MMIKRMSAYGGKRQGDRQQRQRQSIYTMRIGNTATKLAKKQVTAKKTTAIGSNFLSTRVISPQTLVFVSTPFR